jgi:hypothetical protein
MEPTLIESNGLLCEAPVGSEYVMCMACDYRLGFDFLLIIITNNYSAAASSYTLKVHTYQVFSVCCVITSRCLVTEPMLTLLYICILSHIAISLSLSLFLSVFCAACQCFKTLFSVLNTRHF